MAEFADELIEVLHRIRMVIAWAIGFFMGGMFVVHGLDRFLP